MSNQPSRLDLSILPGLLLTLFFLSAWLIPLCGDEAYYWLWSVRPEWGYCDHPPAVAWLGHALQFLAGFVSGEGQNLALFRLAGWLAFVAALLVMARVASECYQESPEASQLTYRWTLAIAAVSPLLAHYATEMGPDSPLLLAWSVGCFAALRAIRGDQRGWLLFGAASALGIYSKLSGWLLPMCLLGFLLFSPQYRQHLRSRALWAGVALGFLLLVPHVLWNYQHNGQNYFFQWTLRRQHMAWRVGNLLKPLELLADQGVLSLYTLVALMWAVRSRSEDKVPPDLSLLLWFSLPLQAFFLVFRVMGVGRWNWPLASYLPLSAVLAVWVVQHQRTQRRDFRLALWATALWTLGSLGMRAFPELQLAMASVLKPTSSHVTVRTNDWALAYPEVGKRLHAAAQQGQFLLNDDYTEAAALSYYSSSFVRVVAPYREGSQFLVWNRYEELLGQDALLVCHRPLENMPHVLHALQSSFESYKRMPSWEIQVGGNTLIFYPVQCKKLIRPLLQNIPGESP